MERESNLRMKPYNDHINRLNAIKERKLGNSRTIDNQQPKLPPKIVNTRQKLIRQHFDQIVTLQNKYVIYSLIY